MHNEVDKLFKEMKDLSSREDDYFIQPNAKDGFIELSNEFFKPAKDSDIEKLKDLAVIEEYVDILKHSNGFHLFNIKFDRLYIGCKLVFYPIDDVIKYKKFYRDSGFFPDYEDKYPVATLQDTGTLYLDFGNFRKGEDYVFVSDEEGDKYHKGSLIDWLERYVRSYGDKYWMEKLLNNLRNKGFTYMNIFKP